MPQKGSPTFLAVCTILTNFSVILPGSFFLLFQLYISSVALVYNFFIFVSFYLILLSPALCTE